ncbi:MAG: hypothetical protein JXA06_10500 [Bacteroidetes bacterium]|nr:hypothetical protein [Bacteroidota bacterium]
MNDPIRTLFTSLTDRIIAYLPSLLAGLLLLIVGWFLGWFLKRIAVRLCIIIRIERLFRKFRWAEDFSKADVRLAAYEFFGNLIFIIVFLIFLSSALNVMSLTTLSNLLDKGILFIPHILIAFIIFGFGWLISYWVSSGIRKALLKEEIPGAALIARVTKFALLLFFSAMALVEINIAREIVIIGFTTIIVTLGALAVVITARGNKNFLNRILQTFEEE